MEPGDLITHIELPPPKQGSKHVYLKLRDRASYEFALASAAVVLEISDGKISSARIALGGVGTKPWRSPEAEDALVGQAATDANFRKAADAALRDAKPQSQNGFKVELAKRCLSSCPANGRRCLSAVKDRIRHAIDIRSRLDVADWPRHAARGRPEKGLRCCEVHVRFQLPRAAVRRAGRGDDCQRPHL